VNRFEIGLTEPQFALLREANLHDAKARSLESFARDILLTGLDRVVAQDFGQRKAAVATLVGTQRRKS
jgi:hypothetical protein